ncbi:MAG: phospholipase D family protein [Pirellulales bacterium]|nr:phospholipase D family protein [Pirellulales bacterium]
MEYEFHLQDPTSPLTAYLFEALMHAAEGAIEWRGMFAFASRSGVDSLIFDPVVQDFLGTGCLSLIVGIDSITNRTTLERLQELAAANDRLDVRVFWNHSAGLFHPKVSHFRYHDGRQSLIVGSGNLTPGGLRENYEGFSVVRAMPREAIDLTSWYRFFDEHRSDIREIDNEALERAARNVVRGGRPRARDLEPDILVPEPATISTEPEILPVPSESRVLVAQIPKAGNRWDQGHFNREVIDQFFRVTPNSAQRVYLQCQRMDGSLADQEVRPCVFSQRNKNLKIEIGAAHGVSYPAKDVPVAVFREVQVRTFHYMLLMPKDAGYQPMLRLTQKLPNLGRGLPRVLTDVATVKHAWPACPLC